MNTIRRLLHYGVPENATEIYLVISGPFFCKNEGLYYEWSCEKIHPSISKVYGDDEIGCLYDLLNGIQVFFKIMGEQGYHVWKDEFGDNGGFHYGVHQEE